MDYVFPKKEKRMAFSPSVQCAPQTMYVDKAKNVSTIFWSFEGVTLTIF